MAALDPLSTDNTRLFLIITLQRPQFAEYLTNWLASSRSFVHTNLQ